MRVADPAHTPLRALAFSARPSAVLYTRVYVQTPERSRGLSLPDNTGIVDDPFIIILCVFVAIVIIVVRAYRYVIRGEIKRGRQQRQQR